MNDLKSIFVIIMLAFVLGGCSASNVSYYEIPKELKSPDIKAEFAKKYFPYINGRKIFLDPGHGGKQPGNVGFEKFEPEKNLNLKVAEYLRKYLQQAGAVVYMSRTKDTTIDLKDRSIMANNDSADVFISIHHNAPGSDDDIWTDYTSTYYHARKGDYEYEPCSRDIARYIQRDISYALRNPGGPGSFDGTYSDYIIYPGDGFSVLRETKIPAVLVECAFSTDHFEAGRLNEDEFNKIEAWGIFRGLCRYFRAGIPEITYLNETDTVYEGNESLYLFLNDSSGIDINSIVAQFDSTKVNDIFYNSGTNLLTVNLENLTPGKHIIRIIVANKNGNHSFPFKKEINILPIQ